MNCLTCDVTKGFEYFSKTASSPVCKRSRFISGVSSFSGTPNPPPKSIALIICPVDAKNDNATQNAVSVFSMIDSVYNTSIRIMQKIL